jgi:hypothetical protein
VRLGELGTAYFTDYRGRPRMLKSGDSTLPRGAILPSRRGRRVPNHIRGLSIGATDIVSEHSITVLRGACLVGAHDCDGNHEANRTSNSNEHARGIIPHKPARSQAMWTDEEFESQARTPTGAADAMRLGLRTPSSPVIRWRAHFTICEVAGGFPKYWIAAEPAARARPAGLKEETLSPNWALHIRNSKLNRLARCSKPL